MRVCFCWVVRFYFDVVVVLMTNNHELEDGM